MTPKETWNGTSEGSAKLHPSTISAVNRLPAGEKRAIYSELIPQDLLIKFEIPGSLHNADGLELLHLCCSPESPSAEMALYHEHGFPDPLLYGQITDTLNGQIHILMYLLNDPLSARFDIDRLPDGTSTRFGTSARNLSAESAAMEYGLAPGQIRRGFRMLGPAIQALEHFVALLGHDLFFVEPLFYHNAVIFERYGFNYQVGRKLMERIQGGFVPGGDLLSALDGSNPFRQPGAADSIRLRSWAIHDQLLGEPFDGVTMYKWVGKSSGISTCPIDRW